MPTGRTGSRNYRNRSSSNSSHSSPENKIVPKPYSSSSMDKRLSHHMAPHHRPPIKHGHSSRPLESKHRLTNTLEPPLRKHSISPPSRLKRRYSPPSSSGPNFSKRAASPRIIEENSSGKIPYTREDLEKITIDIRRTVKDPSPTIRKIVDPGNIRIVRRKEEGSKPLFEREEIKLATVDLREDKIDLHQSKRPKYSDSFEMSNIKGPSYPDNFDNGGPSLSLSERWQPGEKKSPRMMSYKSEKNRYEVPSYPPKERRYSSPEHKKEVRRLDSHKDSHPPERFRKEFYHGESSSRKPLHRLEPPRDRHHSSSRRSSPPWEDRRREKPSYFDNDRNDFRMSRGRSPRGRLITRGRGGFRPIRGGPGFRGGFRPRGNMSSFRGSGGPPRGYYSSKPRSPNYWKHDMFHKMSPDRKSH